MYNHLSMILLALICKNLIYEANQLFKWCVRESALCFTLHLVGPALGRSILPSTWSDPHLVGHNWSNMAYEILETAWNGLRNNLRLYTTKTTSFDCEFHYKCFYQVLVSDICDNEPDAYSSGIINRKLEFSGVNTQY